MSYPNARYWWLHELRRVRASLRVGTQSSANAAKERRSIQKELMTLRKARKP